MKITFLGTSHGCPSAERFCTSLLVQSGQNIYLIDAGAPILDLLCRKGIKSDAIKAIFISHAHSDHSGGLCNFLSFANLRGKNRIATYLPHPALADLLSHSIEVCDLKPYDAERLPLILAQEGVVYEDEAIRVTYIPTAHIPYSYAILVEGEGKRFLFTGDLSNGLAKNDFPAIAFHQPMDAIACEMAHFGAEEIRPCLEKLDVKQFWFTHVNRIEEKFPAIRALREEYSYPIYIAEDNDEILL
ncbi:MAG: ribonuclease Z [Clostridia bacterium]|nr:ribonuclease Z [Clostridia bacterium]